MEANFSEKEQLESISQWWKETGRYIAVAVIVGLLLGFGWRYWHRIERHRAENASAIYQSVLVAASKNDPVTVQGGASLLMKDFSDSPYAGLAALLSAKTLVTENKLPAALTELQWVIKNSHEARLQEIARISAARILLAQQKAPAALAELKTINDQAFLPLVYWVKGDIYTQLNNKKEASDSYLQAKNAFTSVPPAEALMQKQLAQ